MRRDDSHRYFSSKNIDQFVDKSIYCVIHEVERPNAVIHAFNRVTLIRRAIFAQGPDSVRQWQKTVSFDQEFFALFVFLSIRLLNYFTSQMFS
jgi:hypothetical protein